jgi:hypothetical protein
LRIEQYNFGLIVIDGKRYTSDIIIYPDRVDFNWWRKEGHILQVEDLKEAFTEKPEAVVIGTGQSGLMQVPSEVKKCFEAKGIELIVDKTKNACEIYNKLSGSKRVIAALHLTC